MFQAFHALHHIAHPRSCRSRRVQSHQTSPLLMEYIVETMEHIAEQIEFHMEQGTKTKQHGPIHLLE